uniref:BPI1 domain-containing protein n=1 Tax=Macrostomum lignano TaxID=282301 RepID=A0A1I8HQ57_9PLAT
MVQVMSPRNWKLAILCCCSLLLANSILPVKGLDYFLRTQLFANLTKVELPAEIPLPVSVFKIVNLKLTGLNEVSRGCSLQLSQVDESRLQLRACAHAARLGVTFVIKAGSWPVDFIQASIKDTGVSARAVAHMVPGGLIRLEHFDITLGSIDVENTGITGSIITRVMRMNSVRERLRRVIAAEASKKIQAELNKHRLPE